MLVLIMYRVLLVYIAQKRMRDMDVQMNKMQSPVSLGSTWEKMMERLHLLCIIAVVYVKGLCIDLLYIVDIHNLQW